MNSIFDVLQDSSALKAVAPEGLQALAQRGRTRLFAPGAVLMKQGDGSDCLYIVLDGTVKVDVATGAGPPMQVAQLGAGAVVGEMGVLDGSPRSATVTATSEVTALEIVDSALALTCREFPEALVAMLRVMGSRIQDRDELADKVVQIALKQFVGMVVSFKDVTQRERVRQMLLKQALFDPLTELPNAILFHDRLEQAILGAQRGSSVLGVLTLTLDGVDVVNTRLGYRAGDELLRQLAGRLRTILRTSDTVARLSGTRFGILLPPFSLMNDPAVAAKRVAAVADTPCTIGGQAVVLALRMGLARYPDDGRTADELLRRAARGALTKTARRQREPVQPPAAIGARGAPPGRD